MPASPPQNPKVNTHQDAKKFMVLAASLDEPLVSMFPGTNENKQIEPIKVRRTAGGRQRDTATFLANLADPNIPRPVNLQTPIKFNWQVELRYSADDPADDIPIFWGETSNQSIKLSRDREDITVFASIEPYHFGDVAFGYLEHNPNGGEIQIENDIPFNPMIDGIVEGNMSSLKDAANKYFLWADPESSRTSLADTALGQTVKKWTMKEALNSLQNFLNDETFIENADSQNNASIDLTPSPDNLRLRKYEHLPVYLDALLPPHGLDWYVGLSLELSDPNDDESERKMQRKIVIFKRGEGVEKEVYLQKPDQILDLSLTNLENMTLSISIADLANTITGNSSIEQVETTVELFRGWSETDDGLTVEDLGRNKDNYPTSTFEIKQNAWRLWVGNEAGDYSNTRTVVKPIPNSFNDLSAEFNFAIRPKRRKMTDCLTFDSNGRRRPPIVEYFSSHENDWVEVPNGWGVNVLNDQIGVYFAGDIPPPDLVKEGNNARLRITGTLTGDQRLFKENVSDDTSPNARNVQLSLDLSDRFHFRSVSSNSRFSGDSNGADTVDDSTNLQTYVDRVKDITDAKALRVDLSLAGILFEYEIGDIITKVDGRNISFNSKSDTATSKKYLQILGIEYDYQNQRTILEAEPVEDQI